LRGVRVCAAAVGWVARPARRRRVRRVARSVARASRVAQLVGHECLGERARAHAQVARPVLLGARFHSMLCAPITSRSHAQWPYPQTVMRWRRPAWRRRHHASCASHGPNAPPPPPPPPPPLPPGAAKQVRVGSAARSGRQRGAKSTPSLSAARWATHRPRAARAPAALNARSRAGEGSPRPVPLTRARPADRAHPCLFDAVHRVHHPRVRRINDALDAVSFLLLVRARSPRRASLASLAEAGPRSITRVRTFSSYTSSASTVASLEHTRDLQRRDDRATAASALLAALVRFLLPLASHPLPHAEQSPHSPSRHEHQQRMPKSVRMVARAVLEDAVGESAEAMVCGEKRSARVGPRALSLATRAPAAHAHERAVGYARGARGGYGRERGGDGVWGEEERAGGKGTMGL
jgi:hypothetical protein